MLLTPVARVRGPRGAILDPPQTACCSSVEQLDASSLPRTTKQQLAVNKRHVTAEQTLHEFIKINRPNLKCLV